MIAISFVPLIEEFLKSDFGNSSKKNPLEEFIKKLEKLPQNPMSIFQLFPYNSLIIKTLSFRSHPIKWLVHVNGEFVQEGRKKYKDGFKKKNKDEFNGDDLDSVVWEKRVFKNLIAEARKKNTPLRFAVRYQRECIDGKYSPLMLVPDVWLGDKNGSSLMNNKHSDKEKHFNDSLKHFTHPKDFAKNNGVCHLVNPSSESSFNKPKVYLDDWLDLFFLNDDSPVYLHLIYYNKLLSVAFSNHKSFDTKTGFKDLIRKYLPNIDKALEKKYLNILLKYFPPVVEENFDEGQACCPPAQ